MAKLKVNIFVAFLRLFTYLRISEEHVEKTSQTKYSFMYIACMVTIRLDARLLLFLDVYHIQEFKILAENLFLSVLGLFANT